MDIIKNTLSQYFPLEIVYKIIYEYKAIISSTAQIMTTHINSYNNINICWYCRRINVSLLMLPKSYVSHNHLNMFEKQIYEKEDQIPICWDCAH